MTSEKVSDFCHVHRHLVRFAFCKLLEELVLPEMPSAPPESDYGDDNETMEWRYESIPSLQLERRDTFVSASGSSGSSYEAGQGYNQCKGTRGFALRSMIFDFQFLSSGKENQRPTKGLWILQPLKGNY